MTSASHQARAEVARQSTLLHSVPASYTASAKTPSSTAGRHSSRRRPTTTMRSLACYAFGAALLHELAAIARAFDARGIDHAFCGAVALAVHGVPRATRDLDVVARPADLEVVRAAAAEVGFAIEALPIVFASTGIEHRRFTKLEGSAHLMLDVLLAPGPLADVLEDAVRLSWEEGTLSVVSRSTLIRMKIAAGRPQDLADVSRLAEIDNGS